MGMSRRDYETVARVIKNENDQVRQAGGSEVIEGSFELVARALANEFSLTNAGFDKTKFLTACGIK